MAELTRAFIERLAATCSEVLEQRGALLRGPHLDPVAVVSSGKVGQQLNALRISLTHVEAEELEQRHHSAMEWFLDNYYLIAHTAQTMRADLPSSFYRTLPRVEATTGSQRMSTPRVYLLARELLSHLSRPPDLALLERFLTEFQEYCPLTTGELWAFPGLLRAVCLERLIVSLRGIGHEADSTTSAKPLDDACDSELVSLEVRTLIELKTIPWQDVFEKCSLVHEELLKDPADVYANMDFATCDRYRREVEKLALRAGCGELFVAHTANAVAETAGTASGDTSELLGHVGYYLVDEGRAELEQALQLRPSRRQRIGRAMRSSATPVYLASIGLTTAAILALVGANLHLAGANASMVVLGCAIALVPCTAFAIAWVQWLITTMVQPTSLPRLALEDGIDPLSRTVVVIPTLLADMDEVHNLTKRLELHYLANPDPNLRFAILADYVDSLTPTRDVDAELLTRATTGIELLNHRYGEGGGGPFHLLVRKRMFNASEAVWMGWERKRGKLEEFNRLLAGSDDTSYSVRIGQRDGLHAIRYVITLDSDTELPRDAARRLVATLAHPLNRPHFNGDELVSGYTVLQPRLDISPDASHRSLFTRIFAGDTGLDIYSRAVSNVYQDFFDSGVYVGKGIYDVEAFQRCLEGRVPENALLSHDLFEGIYGRAGLVSDVILYEDYPQSYVAYARRLHRWIRGDWQLVPWLRRKVPTAVGARVRNPLSPIDRWKVVDNLRRSLLPIALLVLLVSGWTWLPGNPWLWTAITLTLSAGHVLSSLASRLLAILGGESFGSVRQSLVDLPNDVNRWLLSLAFLPHEAVIVTDAVARTLLRIALTRRRLLEWTTAAHTTSLLAKRGQRSLLWWEMMGGPICGAIVVVLVLWLNPAALPVALIFATLWIVSPEIAWILARPVQTKKQDMSPAHEMMLRKLSRRTWLFFETFVGPDDHWLPPDNVQMVPSVRIAHRTSPTNIGLYLASCATACDLGYMGLRDFCVRVQNTMRTLESLPRYRGQLLNWYETQSLEPLLPKYVSTVDNGNFAASLIAVRHACTDFATAPIFRPQAFTALGDVVDLLLECVFREGAPPPPNGRIKRAIAEMGDVTKGVEKNPEEWTQKLDLLEGLVLQVSEDLQSDLKQADSETLSLAYEAVDWLEVLLRETRSMRAAIESLIGWFHTLSSDAPKHVKLPAAEVAAIRTRCFRAGLEQLGGLRERVEKLLIDLKISHSDRQATEWASRVRQQLSSAVDHADGLLADVLDVGVRCESELATIDFSFLYDTEVDQMFIGYDVSSSLPDRHHYDLLASEARLASLIAIAFGQAPTKHWVHLGRPVGQSAGGPTLLSWSGTMFEYLMPLLFTRSFPKTLLGRSTEAAVQCQMQYARKRKVPWGISESAFAATDSKGDYQYRAFGAPGLGLKRGLEEDLVVAPYASLLALSLAPAAVVANLKSLGSLGALGRYGAMEAVDFTTQLAGKRMTFGRPTTEGCVVQAYMAHHQGMSMVAIGNVLAEESMVQRFHADPRVHTVAHLLQERLPAQTPELKLPEAGHENGGGPVDRVVFSEPWSPRDGLRSEGGTNRLVDPALHVLSNGSLNLLYDSFGRSRLWLSDGHEEIDLRPREVGASSDRAGGFCLYLRMHGQEPRLISGGVSVAAEHKDSEREVTFWPHKVESRMHNGALATSEEVFIAAFDNVEIRRVRLTNEGNKSMTFSLCSYADVSLLNPEEHHRHPAFSRLFLQTSALEGGRILICKRRPRSPDRRYPVLAQAVLTQGTFAESQGDWQTSRQAFIGRGATLEQARWPGQAAPGDLHAPVDAQDLDPCLAQKVELVVAPGESQTVAWVTSAGVDEERALEVLSPYLLLSTLPASHDQCARATAQRVGRFRLAGNELALYQRLLSRLFHRSEVSNRGLGATAARKQLWGYGISGDRPIAILHRRSEESQLLQEVVRAHRFFAEQNVIWDLAIVVHDASGYVDEVREQLRRISRSMDGGDLHPNVTVILSGQLRPGDLEMLAIAAGLVLDTDSGDLWEQLSRETYQPKLVPMLIPTRSVEDEVETPGLKRKQGLLYDNTVGGFDVQRNEYLIFLSPGQEVVGTAAHTPAPWCNLLCNPNFGSLISERGLGCTWAHNASENRLTPWSNDAVRDPASEAMYLRDEETAEVWSPTPGPRPSALPYEVAHGIGYSRYRHRSHGLMQTLKVQVHPRESVKFAALIIENLTQRPRRLTLTYFVDWVLGGRSATHGPFVKASYEPQVHGILASNAWNTEFPEQVAFLSASEKVHGFTVDPVEFLGIGGLGHPDALRRWGLSNSDRSGALACGVLQVHIDLDAFDTQRIHFALGWGEDRDAAIALALKSRQASFLADTTCEVEDHWEDVLGRAVVTTPDPATNLMMNSWALYQTISSRLYGRTGFYQSSGAIGFRDQLQDVMSLSAIAPSLAREHILTAAAHQFEAGDVLHWWHPPRGQGVRTRCSDDLLWLPYAVVRYLETTGDDSILDEEVAFLTGAQLGPDEQDRFEVYEVAGETASLLEHCLRAMERARELGSHGLPLIGGGDWNDGMNLVGVEGKGESVWLGWFLYTVMHGFSEVCRRRELEREANHLEERCKQLLQPLEESWDGAWYRRAYYDDGTPLGSASSTEARIDSISQSWAVLSGAADPDKACQALQSALRELVDKEARVVRLLWPPFDQDRHEPGYIKGYPPGIRENGAQYTHAATWLVWALFRIGENSTAAELFRYLNPITHATSLEEARAYAVEPYVLAGDVYSTGKHRGRGGWSWYTGSAAWYWRIGLEELLGCRVRWPHLEIAPRIPQTWPSTRVELRLGKGSYDINIVNSEGQYDSVLEASLDDKPLLYVGAAPQIDLRKYDAHHVVRVVLGRRRSLQPKAAHQR